MLVRTGIAFNQHPVYCSLRSLEQTDFHIDGVIPHHGLHRHGTEKQVTVIHIEIICHCIVITLQPFHKILLIIYIPFLDIQQEGKPLGIHHRVAHPCDVIIIILVAFVHIYIDFHPLVRHLHHAVRNNGSVPVTQFIISVQQVIFVILVIGFNVLGRLEEIGKALLLGLLHGIFQLLVLHLLVAGNDNLTDFNLFLPLHNHVQNHEIRFLGIIPLQYPDIDVVIPFFLKITLNDMLQIGNHVIRHLSSRQQRNPFLDFALLRIFYPDIVDTGQFMAFRQAHDQINLISFNSVY